MAQYLKDPSQRSRAPPSHPTVCRAIGIEVGKGTYIKATKTDHARVIAIPAALCEVLQAYIAASPYQQPTDWLFWREDEQGRITHLSPQKFSKAFSKLVRRIGVPITLHGTRHNLISLALGSGKPLQAVSEYVGHRQSTTTLLIYNHATLAQKREIGEYMGDLLTPSSVSSEGNSEAQQSDEIPV